MQTNNTLYEKASNFAKEHNFTKIFSKDLDKLKQDGYVVSTIEIDSDLPDTPTKTAFVENDEIPLTFLNLIGYCLSLGIYPVVYQGENNGRLLRHVVPKEGLENQISSYGSNLTFYPHVDNPDLRLREESQFNEIETFIPDTLSLLCLRKHEGVATSILLLKDVLKEFSEDEILALEEPVFIIKRPASFIGNSSCENLPLIKKCSDGSFISRFDYHNVFTNSEKHALILEKFKEHALDKNKWIELYLEPGQIVIFDNQKTLHTRNGFTPRFDGKDRWLIRVFGCYNKPEICTFVSKECNHHLKTM